MATRVLIVDDHRPVSECIQGLLESHSDIDVVGEAKDGTTALDMIDKLAPDIVITDVVTQTSMVSRQRATCQPLPRGERRLREASGPKEGLG